LASEALRLADIDAYYGDSHVLHRVSFACGEGRLVGLLGRNGAGKTTSVSVVMGLLRPRAGSVAVYGTPVAGRPPGRPRRSPRRALPWCRRGGASSAA
jgi:branched-chain amino acid transport system ATP-binding protein